LNTLKQAGLLVTKGKPPATRYYIKRDEDIGELKNEKHLDIRGIYFRIYGNPAVSMRRR
jgi:hypothetical protein